MRNGLLLKIVVPAAAALAFLLFYQNVFTKSADSLSDLKDREQFAAKSLVKYERLVSSIPQKKKKLEEVKELKNSMESDLFEGQSLSVIGADLQNSIKTAVAASGGTLSSEKVENAKPLNEFTVISASFEMTLPDTNALTNMLYQIETHRPSIAVKELYIQRSNINDPKTLTVRLTVSALTGGFGNGAAPVMDTAGGVLSGRPGKGQFPNRMANQSGRQG
ncbi:MAG: type II secretion system protein GspM [Nitrospiraceae bacterium]|nr:type II secretion system protein GspM [Nitrospiraceae bacterium]